MFSNDFPNVFMHVGSFWMSFDSTQASFPAALKLVNHRWPGDLRVDVGEGARGSCQAAADLGEGRSRAFLGSLLRFLAQEKTCFASTWSAWRYYRYPEDR